MKHLQTFAAVVLTLALAAAVGAGAWWLVTHKPEAKTADKPPPPAAVGKVAKEDELNTVTLTEEAEKRIGLAVAPVEKKAVRRMRVYGGEVAVPVGRTILVAAPLGGTLEAPPGGIPDAGKPVKKGDVLVQLKPLLSPEAKITISTNLATAEGQAKATEKRLEAAQVVLVRAKNAYAQGTGSKAAVEVAQGNYDEAAETHEAAKHNREVLAKALGDLETGTAAPIPIPAPRAGVLRAVSALPGQTVPGGAALFEVMDVSTVWVRVPLPVGDLDAVDRTGPAQVGKLSAPTTARLATATPVAAPPSANPLAATVDLVYEMPNPDGKLFPGQRLGVSLPLADATDGLTVPWAAVVIDIHGGTWVYERVGLRKYARRRVVVCHTAGADAVLASGPPAGTPVVTAGVQQLFAAETGFVK